MSTDRPPAPSLAARLATALSASDTGHDRRAGIAVAVLLVAAPLAVWAGARWTESGVRGDIVATEATARPRLAVLAARTAARAEFEPLLSTPGVAATLDGLATALPGDAGLARAGRGADRRLSVDVATADPDRLRAALRRSPTTAGLRDAGQRRVDGGMTVTLEQGR